MKWCKSEFVIFIYLIIIILPCNYDCASGRVSMNRNNNGAKGSPYPKYSGNKFNRNMNDQNFMMDMFTDMNNSLPDEQKLLLECLRFYDPASRPVYNASKKVTIGFSFALIQICDMDERNQILTTNVWLEQEWYDERLVWNSSDYNYLDKIRLPCNRIWLPDIVLYNSADDYTEGYMQSKAMVKPDGEVFWSPPAKLRSSCKIDVTYFPFDDQLCYLKFGSWTYSGYQVDIVNKSVVDMSNYIESGEWELISVTSSKIVNYYPIAPNEPYPLIIFSIHMRRRILYFLFNIIIPCIWLSIICLVGFWLPPDSGEKITLGITVLLAFSVFMLLIAENIPATSEMVPLIGIYLTITMSLASVSIILTVFVLQLHHANEFSIEVPSALYSFLTKKIANMVGFTDKVKSLETQYKLINNDSVPKLKTQNKDDENVRLCFSSCFCRCCFDSTNKISNKKHIISESIENENSQKKTIEQRKMLKQSLKTGEYNYMEKENPMDYKISEESKIMIPPLTMNNHNPNALKLKGTQYNLKKTTSIGWDVKSNSFEIQKTNNQNSLFFQAKPQQANAGNNRSYNLNYKKLKRANIDEFKYRKGCKNHSNQMSRNNELTQMLCSISSNIEEHIKEKESSILNKKKIDEWKLMAIILDRFLFWIFTMLTVVSSIILLVVLPTMKNQGFIG